MDLRWLCPGASMMGGGQSPRHTFTNPVSSLSLSGSELAWSAQVVTVAVPTGAIATEATLSGVMMFALTDEFLHWGASDGN